MVLAVDKVRDIPLGAQVERGAAGEVPDDSPAGEIPVPHAGGRFQVIPQGAAKGQGRAAQALMPGLRSKREAG
jgi:hypothetical protein